MLKPSKYQAAIYDFVENGQGDAVVEAVAGSGKTTTLIEAIKRMRGSVLFVAFNRHIVQEIKDRLPETNADVFVKTLNGVGHGIVCKNSLHDVQLNPDKLHDIIKAAIPEWPIRKEVQRDIKTVIRFLRAHLAQPDDQNIQSIMDANGIVIGPLEYQGAKLPETYFQTKVKAIFEASEELFHDEGLIDFDDQIYLTGKGLLEDGWKTRQYDWVLVDEAQDLNRGQHVMVMHLAKPTGRIVAVGDPNQAIYGFRGADSSSMGRMRDEMAATTLPLSVSYRCPRKVVELANKYVPHMLAAEDAEEGTVRLAYKEDVPHQAKQGDMVICRYNAPLVSLYFQLVAQKKRAVIRGRDIGAGFLSFIDKTIKNVEADEADPDQFPVFLAALKTATNDLVEKYLDAEKTNAAQMVMDRQSCIEIIASNVKSLEEMKAEINFLFSNRVERGRVLLSSIHRSKGLEAKTVFIIDSNGLPASPDQQEINCAYVAYTRAKKELVLA